MNELVNSYKFEDILLGETLSFEAGGECFSPRAVDRGTKAMLSVAVLARGMKVLDLGCGYGAVGVACARIAGQENVTMSDVDAGAAAYAKANAARNGVPGARVVISDGFYGIDETGYDIILCNPPYQVDFKVPKHFIEKGFNRLKIGGRMYMVTKRLEWYKRKLIAVFGGVKIHRIDGYHVFVAIKTSASRANASGKNEVTKNV